MHAASNLAYWRVRAAAGFDWTLRAIELTGPMNNCVGLGDMCAGTLEGTPLAAQRVVLRTTILVGPLVPMELATRQCLIRALRLVPHWHVRFYPLVVHHPIQ
jgi:hypothetical protein